MKHTLRAIFLISLLSISCGSAVAQVATGTPPFGSFGGGPVDTINLANLNVHISVPVLRKAGRGLPFSYNLGYDNSIWYPVTSGSTTSWQPTLNWGWIAQTEGAAGTLNYYTIVVCVPPFGCYAYQGAFDYIDPFGVPHWSSLSISNGAYSCNGVYFSTFPYSCPTTDGSGYAIITSTTGFSVSTPSGTITIPPQNINTGAAGETDANGNQITVDSSGHFYDTLSSTTPVLTIGGSGTQASPNTLTYTAPSGAHPYYQMNYTNYTVATNFGVPGITEYRSSAVVPLPTSIVLPDGSLYTFQYEPTPTIPAPTACTPYAGTTCVTGRITSMQLPTVGTITYAYSGGANNNGILPDGSAAGMTRQTPDGMWTYARTLGTGAATITTVTAPTYNGQTNQTVMNFQGIYPTETQAYQGSSSGGTLLGTTLVCYNGATPSGTPATCNSTAVTLPIAQKATYKMLPGGLESEVKMLYDTESCGTSTCTDGLVTEKDEYGYGSPTPGPLVRKTLTTYASLGNGIVGRPSSVTVCSGTGTASACNNAGTVIAQTTYCYDEATPSGTTNCNATGSPTATSGTPQHVAVNGSRGNVTTIASLVSGTTTLGKKFTYWDTGNVKVATDVNGAQTTPTYGGCSNSFPTSVAEPLGGMTTSMTWNCVGGVVTSMTDENNKTVSTSYTHDPYFWRPESVTDQLSNVTNLTYNGDLSVESASTFNSSTSDVLATVDSLGRPRFAQHRQSPSSTTFDSSETDYDSLGRPYKVTLPYAGTAGQPCPGNCPATITLYDPLGRPTLVTDGGNGTMSYSYAQNDTFMTAGPQPNGENTKRKQLEYDALGRVTSVCEITSATGSGTCAQTSSVTGFWTQYTYDVNNDLTGVSQNAQSGSTQTRTFAYDDLGRMTSDTNNPESGTTTYTYDTDATCGTSTGDLVKKVDALVNTTCFAYDALHRPTSVTYPSGAYASVTPKKYFVYDTATVNSIVMANAKTRVAEAYTCFSPCTTKLTDTGFSYTARGEVTDTYQSTPHSGSYYHVNQTYLPNGTTNQLSGLSGLPTITYNVDGEGRVNSAAASSGQNPLSSTAYNVASLPTQVNLGSSDGDTFGYDVNTNRMNLYSFNVNSQSVVGNLGWNQVGTLASLLITDPFNSSNTQSCSYSHDDLTRLASANCGSAANQTFSYDAFGNINKDGSPYSFHATYNPSTNHMATIAGSGPSYDPNGNVTNDFLHTYGWDANGRPVTIDGVGLTYDALGNMVEQNRSGAYAQIVYAPSGAKLALMNGSTIQKAFVPLTGGAMAVYTSQGGGTSSATPGTGSATISGSEQSKPATSAAPGTGSVTISGTEQSVYYGDPCAPYGYSCPTYIIDIGTVSVTVNGVACSTTYGSAGSPSTSSAIATALATACTSSTLAATASGGVLTLTAKTTGAATNYPLSTSVTWTTTYFSSPSFTATASGSTLTGGTDAGPAVYDSGTVQVTVNGFQSSASYGQSSTTASLASAIANVFNTDSSSPVTASVSGSTITVTSKLTGASTNYSLSSSSSTSQPTTFSQPSFSASVSGATLTGGSDGGAATVGLAYYRHSDWLGSNRLCSTPARTVVCDIAYDPFGGGYAQTGAIDLSFTGMNQDTVPNLYDFPAREYGIQGRWPSPDPAGIAAVDLSDPQTWNRYAYVRNNPLAITDPTGLCGEYSSTYDASCGSSGDDPGPCLIQLITGCWEPFPGDVYLGPITIFISSAPATRGLPSGFLATGPGIDYSWLGLLDWALGLQGPCDPLPGIGSPCVMNANGPLDPPGICTYQDSKSGVEGVDPKSSASRCEAKGGKFDKLSWSQRTNKYLGEYLPCAAAEGIDAWWGDADKAFVTLVTHLGPLTKLPFGKAGKFLGVAAPVLWDLHNAAEVNRICTADVYGVN